MENLSLFKHGRSGVWFIQYRSADGIRKQKSTRCSHKADAVKVLADFKKFLAEGSLRRPILLSSFTKDFLTFAKTNYAAKTVYIYETTLEHFKRIFGDRPLTQITAKHFDHYKVSRLNENVQARLGLDELERKVSPTSVNIELRGLRAAMYTAVRWQLIPRNPFEKLPLIAIPKRTPAFLTSQDADTLLKAITQPWLKDFIIFAVNTGMRRGEMLALRWIDIGEAARVARITNRAEFTTKSGEERIVSLNDAALMVIQRRRQIDQGEYIFTDDQGRKLLKDRITHAFKAAIRAAGLPDGLHLHSTRHSFASLLVGSGTSLFTVSKLLGHANAKTSEIYSHLLPQHLHSEVGKINIGIDPLPVIN